MWIELIKANLHRIPVGEICEMSERKAMALIASGHAKKVSKPKLEKVEKPKRGRPAKVETAVFKPKVETADFTPKVVAKEDIKDKK